MILMTRLTIDTDSKKYTKFIPNALEENWSGNSIYGNWSLCKFCKVKNIKKWILKRELKKF